MTATDTVTARGVRMRVRPWRGRPDTAELSVVPAGAVVLPNLVALAVERARDRGYDEVVTPALPRGEWRPSVDIGFSVREELHLLAHDLLSLPERREAGREHHLRRVLRRDRDRVLAVDGSAFDPFWRLDADALEDAVRATPSTRFRGPGCAGAPRPRRRRRARRPRRHTGCARWPRARARGRRA